MLSQRYHTNVGLRTTTTCRKTVSASKHKHVFFFEDPFGDHLISMMNIIHSRMNLPPDFRLKECGTQEYEADVVNLEQRGTDLVFNHVM